MHSLLHLYNVNKTLEICGNLKESYFVETCLNIEENSISIAKTLNITRYCARSLLNFDIILLQ